MKFNKMEHFKKEKVDELKDSLLIELTSKDFSEKELFDFVFNKVEVSKAPDGLSKEEVKKWFLYYIEKHKTNFSKNILEYFGSSMLSYLSTHNKIKDSEKTILDCAYETYYELAEKNPEELMSLTKSTNPMQEYVSPDVFFNTFLKIKKSEVLNKYFGGDQFHQLEYNITYHGAEDYLDSLLSKINFKNPDSIHDSSRLINLSASLADYAHSGSYSGKYEIDKKIINKLSSECDKKDSVYLLGSKTRYILDRLEKEYPPFVSNNKIFDLAPNTLGFLNKKGLNILNINNKEDLNLYNQYIELCNKVDTPPQELIEEAIKKGEDFVTWSPDRSLIETRGQFSEKLVNKMNLFSINYFQGKNINNNDLDEFINLVSTDYKNFLEDEFNIDLSEFSIEEKFYFLNFIKQHTNESILPVKDFVKEYKNSGFRTFLSIEHGGKEMGDKILTLGEKLPKESAEILFKTYSEMIDAADEVTSLLQENLKEKATPELVSQVRESLLIGGKDLLEKYAKKVSLCEGKDCENIGEELRERLSLAKKSIFAFSYACKTLVEKGEFSFEDFEKAKLVYEKSPLPEDIKNQIINMHKINTEQYPEKLRELWRNTLKNGLENPNPKQLVVSVSFENYIVSAMRVIEQEDGSFYGASFNINPTVQGSKVGSELLKKVLLDLAKDKPFVADCYSKNPMLDTYLNKFGFKITKEIENYEDTGELVYQITLSPEN